MEYSEIRDQIEAGLAIELGLEQPFRVVEHHEWTGRCPQPPHTPHLEDIPRACFDCFRIHVPESEYADFTEARVAASVEIIVEQFHEV
ncbi:MAG: hypothetical protein V3S37_08025 [Dehalococcoidia bacterium]